MNHERSNHLKLSQLQILIAVTDYGSFSEAALQLQMSQSAISYAIATLEEDLGVVLFTRGRYGANLTPVGQQIVERARQICYLMEDIIKQADLAKGLKGGQVRISSFRSAATHILPEVIAEFCQLYPAIAVSIAEYDDCIHVESDLREGRADLGIIYYYLPTHKDLEIIELMRDEFVVLIPPDFQLKGQNLTWEELTKYPLIMAPDGDTCDAMVYAHSAKFGVTLNAIYHVRSDATIVSMVAKGLGAAITPRLAAVPIPKEVQIYSLPVPFFRMIGIAILKDALLTPATFAFLDLLKEQFNHL
ncbi:LysR family transcriptional regulator [Aphanothece hegewaldii CCALA 016]|uniref:LysR family transcriptional regulator n=2 Tax=Aphanothece TaxID=1121 RepID=A0A2T1M1J1_9CHRO|nr:LysR family transcriptional regulator [Aphanothece hegewaldii CCALA 016]